MICLSRFWIKCNQNRKSTKTYDTQRDNTNFSNNENSMLSSLTSKMPILEGFRHMKGENGLICMTWKVIEKGKSKLFSENHERKKDNNCLKDHLNWGC